MLFLSDFNETWFCSKYFRKIHKYISRISMEAVLFHADGQIWRSLLTLLTVLRQHLINVPWEDDSLRNNLHVLGLKWKKLFSWCRILTDRPDAVPWRGKYFVNISTSLSEGTRMFYLDDDCVGSNTTLKCGKICKMRGYMPKQMAGKTRFGSRLIASSCLPTRSTDTYS